ncbi:ATP-binding protein [uncultured Rhodospira sp.]|uniref:sensor histidine kinase n=1 Tax=uncultured Rhodospira sp. TaxID=1936189 RepID=UPI002608AF03|nr:ATP-binding protein [uncultured Rhodospira sp.]
MELGAAKENGSGQGAAAPPARPQSWHPAHGHRWRSDLTLFLILATLGVAASFVSVNIPHTEVFLDGRHAFGFLGFAVLRRWWLALALGLTLSLAGYHVVPLEVALAGNLAYQLPALALIRVVHRRVLDRLGSLVVFGIGWLLLVLTCYQLFVTPLIHAVMALLRDAPLWPLVLEGWRTQPFLIESILVGIVSTAGVTVLRSYRDLAHRQHELDVLLRSLGDAVVATDTAGRLTRINPRAEHMTGWTAAEARGRPLDEIMTLVNSHTGRSVASPVARVLAEGRLIGLANHTTLIAHDGARRQVADSAAPIRDVDGNLMGVVMVFRDVTESYAAREALAESKQQLDLAVESAGLGIWDWDAASGRVALRGWQARLFGFPPDAPDVPVEVFKKHVHPEDWAETWAKSLSARDAGQPFDCTFRVVRPDGSMIWVRAIGKALTDESGTVRRVIGTAQDVTERKTTQDQLHETIDALTRSNIELERFAYVASHDLQEPIRNMVAYSQLLSQRYDADMDEDAKAFLGFIVDGAKRMHALVLDLLEYSRLSTGNRAFGPVDMAHVVAVACANLRESIEDSGTQLSVDPMPEVQGDEVQLVSLMQNLIGNAIKFRRADRRPEITVSAHSDDAWHVVEVADNGIGIDSAHCEQIFQVFKRLHTRQDYPGTGIGLALAKRIVEGHGGRIAVDSTPGQGSRFQVRLPRAAGPTVMAPGAPRSD